MRGLAGYVMAGRLQAATVAVLFGLMPGFSIISGAVVALVTLRRGVKDGLQILLWALLPALLLVRLGDPSSLLVLLGVLLVSCVLRHAQRWQSACVALTSFGLLLQLSLPYQHVFLERMETVFANLLANGFAMQVMVDGAMTNLTPQLLMQTYSLHYGYYQMLLLLAALMLGRYWQALLYNPGGFREEFHNLRFDLRLMGLLLVLVVAGSYGVAPLNQWLMMLSLIPLLNGLAVIHKAIAIRRERSADKAGFSSTGLVVLTYLLLPFAATIYVILGFADSVIDIRKRLAAR
jgi:hypothetical protein